MEKRKIMIKGTAGFNITKALAVRRITKKDAVCFFQSHLLQRKNGERNPACQTGLADMTFREING